LTIKLAQKCNESVLSILCVIQFVTFLKLRYGQNQCIYKIMIENQKKRENMEIKIFFT